MRSLSLKLTLAFLFVGIVGIALVSLIVGQRTQREFDQFILDRFQIDLVNNLADHYQQNGSWDRVNAVWFRSHDGQSGPDGLSRAPVTLLDANRIVVVGGRRYQPGQRVPQQEANREAPIRVDGDIVGWLLFDTMRPQVAVPESPESVFLKNTNQAIFLGALGAIAAALILGALFARAISRPVRELTAATQAVAQGELGHQAPVRTQDELGQLAQSFNQMSADLARANQQRRQMTADIAHDLRTPLSVIMGYTEALDDGKLHGTPEMYQVMHKQALLLNHLIDDLRTLSLVDAGKLSLICQPIAPRLLLERMILAHAAQAERQNVALRIDVVPDLPEINVDPDRMTQVLNNLVSNALRHTPNGGEIILLAESDDTYVYLRIKDTGSGIDPADLPHIFSRFYQGDKSRASDGESGLGLAIARSLVEAQGGKITAVSPPSQGATFTIALPFS